MLLCESQAIAISKKDSNSCSLKFPVTKLFVRGSPSSIGVPFRCRIAAHADRRDNCFVHSPFDSDSGSFQQENVSAFGPQEGIVLQQIDDSVVLVVGK
jgi:hypothetical protein